MKGRGGQKGIGVAEGLLLALYFLALLVVGVLTVGAQGITWDEPNYFGSSYSYLSWFGHVAENPGEWWASIDRYWEPSHEAPPFFKLWAGLFAGGGALLLGTEDLAAVGDAYRMGSYALFLVSTYVAFRFAREEFGVVAGWGTALGMPLIPALFGFARLGQIDGAASSMFLVSALATFRMLELGGRRRIATAGVLLGLAFATKLTAFPLVVAPLLWVFVYGGGELRARLLRLLAGFGIGACTFFTVWPWLWRDPVGRTWEYLTWAGGLEKERFAFYLGEWWAGAPFHLPFVALVAYTPLVVAVAGVCGVARMLVGATSPAAGWVLVHLSIVLAVSGSGLVPIYGGPRQFLAAFGLWAICAGVGLAWAASRLRPLGRPAVPLALYCALALPGVAWTGAANSLEYYGEGVGLIPGARTLGFETTYLADTYGHALSYLNEEAGRGATVYVQAGTFAVVEAYRRTGELREDLRPAYLAPVAPDRYTVDESPRPGSFFLFLPRQSIYTNGMLALEEKAPLYAFEKGGVPLVSVVSGEAVGETLGIEGAPAPRDVGLWNAAVAFGLPVLLLYRLLRAQKKQGEEGE